MKIDYLEMFRNRVIYITGVGRSGTTIVGQLFASMRPAYYLFEPAILRPPFIGNSYDDTLRRNLFEDYFLHQLHGRYNPNPNDWTFYKNFITEEEIKFLWNRNRRSDVEEKLKTAIWVIKNPEAQPNYSVLGTIFPGVQFLNIVRNGIEVVRSSMERGWFTDDYQPIDRANDYGKAWYLNVEDAVWEKWNPLTRAAFSWTELMKMSSKRNSIKYEDFCVDPLSYITGLANAFKLKFSVKTFEIVDKIKAWKEPEKPELSLGDIDLEVRLDFIKTMEEWGY